MKKRKRRMRRILISSRLECRPLNIIVVITLAWLTTSSLSLVPRTVNTSALPNETSGMQDVNPLRVAKIMVISPISNSTKISRTALNGRYEEPMKHRTLLTPSEDDLLAVESGSHRILSIGKSHTDNFNPAHTSTKLAPYASNIPASNYRNLIVAKRENRTDDGAQVIQSGVALNETHQQLLAPRLLYRPPAPVFIRHPPSQSTNLRLLYPTNSSQNTTNITTTIPANYANGIHGLAWIPPPPARPIYLLGPRQVLVPTSMPRPTLAPPLVAPPWLADQSPTPSSNRSVLTQKLLELNMTTKSDRELEAPPTKIDGSVTEILDPDGSPVRSNSTRNGKLLNWLNQSVVDAEDEFERHLNEGQYQRTKSMANMSWAQILRQANESDVMESLLVTNTSVVSLWCDTEDMLVRFKFRKPFHGRLSSTFDRDKSSKCRVAGTGAHYYEMRVPLNDCGTKRENPRLFINNIQIQFYQSATTSSFDLDGDELKTIICSYPLKPRAPPPSERIVEAPTDAPLEQQPAKLSQVYYEPLLLISGLVMLALAFVGLTTSAYLIAKRKRQLSSLSDALNSSPISGNIYRRAPAQLANTNRWLAPPLIGAPRSPRPTATSSKSETKAISRTSPIQVTKPPRKSQHKREPTVVGEVDSLVDDSKSVTTIEVSYSKDKYIEQHTQPIIQTQSKAVQAEDESVPFSSLRPTLTSPREFKRLQEIARLFDPILIENHVDRGDDRSIVYTTTRLSPSKYKTRILDVVDEQELRELSHLLRTDELFRSLVIESTDEQIFRRKLRKHPMYASKFKSDTWRLLRDVLLDPELAPGDSA